MLKNRVIPLAMAALLATLPMPSAARTDGPCKAGTSHELPTRQRRARSGSQVMRDLAGLRGPDRDMMIEREVMSGNIPDFLRGLVPVTMGAGGTTVTICVMPDYLAVGDDGDFVRTPLGLPAAARIGLRLGFLLPTTKMVDAIYGTAQVRLEPRPMPAGPQMTSTDYLLRHNATVNGQLGPRAGVAEALVAGQQKDLVLTNRLLQNRGRVAIYGWHRLNGKPIQPLTTVHHADYADYSHGIRLVGPMAWVNGAPQPLVEVMSSPNLAGIVSGEGPIRDAVAMMAAVAE